MLSIFIFKSNALGMQYGMGTYIRELTDALLKYTSHRVYLVSYHNHESKEFNVENVSSLYIKINIPSPRQSAIQSDDFGERYAASITYLLAPIIDSIQEVVFHFNATPDVLKIMLFFKERYNHPHIAVAHFTQWQLMFKGNKKKLLAVNISEPTTIEDKALVNEKRIYELADAVVTVTQQTKQYFIDTYNINGDKINYIPNGIEAPNVKPLNKAHISKLKKEWGFNMDEKIILYTGRIDEAKGVFFLIKAFEHLCKSNSNLRLVFAGSGSISQVIRKTANMHGKITYTEFISHEKLTELYQLADIAVFPSLYDQCPYSVLEMLIHKIPLVLSQISGLVEIYQTGQCVWLKPQYTKDGEVLFNVKKLAQAMHALILDKNTANNMANMAYIELNNKFSAKNMARSMENVYTTISHKNKN